MDFNPVFQVMTQPESVSPKPPSWPRFRGFFQLLLLLAVLAVIVLVIFPIIFELRIEAPTALQFGSPSTLAFQISNPNLTPLTDIAYTCEVSKLTLGNGSEDEKAKDIIRGSIRRIEGRRAVAGRCETADVVTSPIKAAEYKVTMTYRTYPWPHRRGGVYRISAQVNDKGDVIGWKVN